MKSRIRTTVQVLIQREQSLLVYKGYDKKRRRSFYRPIGGGVDFGETGAAAALREFREESGLKIHRLRFLGFLENIFTYHGEAGHEWVLVFSAEFHDQKNYRCERFPLQEGKRTLSDARWVSVKTLLASRTAFYPAGIKDLVKGAVSVT